VALSDAAGDTVQLYEYSVYGQVAASDPNHPNPFLFTGRRFDTDTGLYYYRARYYNPYIGRFLQTDPIGYGDGMNSYWYCGNSPTGFVDPFGLIRIWRRKEGHLVSTWKPPFMPLNANMMEFADYDLRTPETWNRKNFFYHYRWGRGQTVNIGYVGLLERFKSNGGVPALVEAFKADVRDLAEQRFEEMDADWNEWEAQRDAGLRPLPTLPTSIQEYIQADRGLYNFARRQYLHDALYVLGHGWLQMRASVKVERYKNGGGKYSILCNFWFRDWFIDVLDPFNWIDDRMFGTRDYDDCTPFMMQGGWVEEGGVKEFI